MNEPYDLSMFVASQRRNVENLSTTQLTNEFKCFVTEWKNIADMPYPVFERMCLVSDRLFDMNNRKPQKKTKEHNYDESSIAEVLETLDNIFINTEQDDWINI